MQYLKSLSNKYNSLKIKNVKDKKNMQRVKSKKCC